MAWPFFERLFGARVGAPSGVPTFGMIPPLGSVASAAGLLVSQATAMTVPAVYRAVTVRSNDVARCKPSLQSYSEATKTHTKIKPADHPIAQLLTRPNRVQTWFEFIRDTWVAYLLRGNAYWAIKRDSRGTPIELIWINPDAVMVLEAVDGQWFYQVNRIGLFMNALLREFPVAIPAEDIIHFRGPSFNMLIATSTIGLGRDSIALSMGQVQQQARWLGNGARPGMILESPKVLGDAAAKRLKQSWEDFVGGLQQLGKTAVLEDGITARQMQLTSVDLQFIEQCNFTIQDCARFFGVPLRKLYQPDTSRGSTVIQEDQAYVNETIGPDLEMLEQKLSREFDLDREGLSIDFDESPLLRADPLTRYNLGRIGKLSGLISTNEWRAGERLPPDPNGDELSQPVNLAVLGSDASGTAGDSAGRPSGNNEPAPKVKAAAPEALRDLNLTVNVDAKAGPKTRRGTIKRGDDGGATVEFTDAVE
jgi:HK97 family phage portal protein